MNMIAIGFKDGKEIQVSIEAVCQFGVREIRRRFGLTRMIPFKTGFTEYDITHVEDVDYENQVEADIKKQIKGML